MSIKVCVAGATGWTGKAVTSKILESSEFELTGAVARHQAGKDIGEVIGKSPTGLKISSSVEEALARPADVLVDYTHPEAVKANILAAFGKGVRVVVGTSGLTAEDYLEIEKQALARKLGIIAAGNFSLTAALAKHFALIAARYLPSWEIIDYASAGKVDVPSGTTRELAEELEKVAQNKLGRPLEEIIGPREARGASIAGTPVHSIRLPGFVIAFETLFGLPDERLVIRHEAGSSADPYVGGTLYAVQKVMGITGLVRGLDRLLFE